MEITTELRDHPVFICGHPKSGTSLVRAILDSHPQLVVYPEESTFFRNFLPRIKGLDKAEQLEMADRHLIHIFSWNQDNPPSSQTGFPDRDYSDISFESVRCQMRQLVSEHYQHEGDLLSAAVMAFGQVTGQIHTDTRHWVEKSPYNEYYTERIFLWWPMARCIHILRDPCDNYVSYQRKHSDWSPEFFSANWKRSTRSGIRNQASYGNSRYFIMRYEDLVHSPVESLKNLTEFLDIDWSASLETPTRAGKPWKGNSMFTDRFQGISPAPVARWKENLSAADATTIELMTAKYLDYFQYSHEIVRLSYLQTLSIRWRVFTYPISRRLTRFQHLVTGLKKGQERVSQSPDDESLDD